MRKQKKATSFNYDRRHGVPPLPGLTPGETVLVKLPSENKWQKSGQVVLADPEDRKYTVATERGVVQRNTVHVQAVPEGAQSQRQEHESEPPALPPVPSSMPASAPPVPQPRLRRSERTITKPVRHRDDWFCGVEQVTNRKRGRIIPHRSPQVMSSLPHTCN